MRDLGDTFAAAKLLNGGLAAQAVEDDADLFLGRIVTRRMSRTRRSDGDGFADISLLGGSGSLGLCLMSTPDVVTMSPKRSIPQAVKSVS